MTGLRTPWGVAFVSENECLVGLRDTAQVLRLTQDGGAWRTTELGTVPGMHRPDGGEGGLLGLALAPNDASTLYAYVSTADDNRVVRMGVRDSGLGSPSPVLTGIPVAWNHNGGGLLFDADGMLFVSTGDAAHQPNAQNRSSLAGKILRITPEGQPAPGNPFSSPVYSYGHRNVQGLAFDAGGRLWATEFGASAADELNLITRGGNYGWPEVEGMGSDSRFINPKVTWEPTSTSSPGGIAIVNGTAFVGALRGQCLYSVALNGESAAQPQAHFQGQHGRLRTVVAAPDGSIWVTTSNRDSRGVPKEGDDQILVVRLT